MNYVEEYEEIISASGMRGISCELLREEEDSVQIIVGEDEQIARRIKFMVDSGLNRNESLEDDLQGVTNLFKEEDYNVVSRWNDFYEFDEDVYIHKHFK